MLVVLLLVVGLLAAAAGALGGYALMRRPLDELADRLDSVVQYGTGTDYARIDVFAQMVDEVVASQKALVYAAACQGITLEQETRT